MLLKMGDGLVRHGYSFVPTDSQILYVVNEVMILRQEHTGTAKCTAPTICSESKPRAPTAAATTQRDGTPKSLQRA